MQHDLLQSMDPRLLGRRIQEARRTRGKTQQEMADVLGVARTTITALEKGERRARPDELVRLAEYLGRTVGELLRPGEPPDAFTVQLRAVLAPEEKVGEDLDKALFEFQRLCEDYLELERLTASPLRRAYPPEQKVKGTPVEQAAEDLATAERNRLGLGEGPVANVRQILEYDVGLRIFYLPLPSRISAMFAHSEELGGCIAVNRNHPEERRRQSLLHDYCHFLTNRYKSEIAVLERYHREPEQERVANAFARAFLLPTTGLRRRFNELKRAQEGKFTLADLCTLAHYYFVSVEALSRRLEELRLITPGTWDRVQESGFKVREAQALLRLTPRPSDEMVLPPRYVYLAFQAHRDAKITEGQLARYLRVDRVQARALMNDAEESGAAAGLTLDADPDFTSPGPR